ncbi:N-acyl amino acid synthase FeeM domain-containing protein [Niallia sp. Krafla_26]|uniref:N-acyl amino acid synthase FeeM domain-containing protein n=1 Tax=Niallia sp. Krafla_26 TaxID=3064703 RepID=UPI003D167CD2
MDKKEYYFGCAEGDLRHEAITLHHTRYEEVGFFKKDEDDPYADSSTYFIVQTTDPKEVVGVTRLIFMPVDELPTIKHFNIMDLKKRKLLKMDQNQYAEISAFTKLPKHDVGLGLIKTVLNYSLTHDLTHWVCCIDERVYNYMHRIFKFPFEVIGESDVYLGSVTIPCLLNLTECLDTLKKKRPPLYDYLTDGLELTMEVVNK